MSEAFRLEVPEFASLLRAPCDPNGTCNDCCNIFDNCGTELGVLNIPVNERPECTCHDICVEEVTLVCAKTINRTLDYPPIGRCRLGDVTLPNLPGNTPCKVFVSCAEEALVGCDTTSPSVSLTVGLLIVCENVVIPTCFTLSCTSFTDFATCTAVTGSTLRARLKEIDGSCMVIQVNARTNGDGTQIIVTGKVIDKLWKHENLWITGLRPYELNQAERDNGFISITVKQDFGSGQAIPSCSGFNCQCP